jgi:pyruvate,water dikinase
LSDTALTYLRWFRDLTLRDVPQAGGKNASLGEMTRSLALAGVRVPDGSPLTTGSSG